jgi:hypothetical protein
MFNPGRVSGSRVARTVDRETFPILVLLAYAAAVVGTIGTWFGSDSWLMLVAGREIAEHGIPHHDGLTAWTIGRVWVDQQWLAHIGGYGLYELAGPAALVLVNAAAAVGGLALAVVGARRGGASARSAAFVALVCAPALIPFAVIRPQTLSYPLFVGLFLLLESSSAPTRMTLLCLPLLVLWANLHGSALLGVGLVSLWAVVGASSRGGRLGLSRVWEHYAGLAAASWLCLLATPYTLSVVGYYRRIVFNPAFGDVVTEWMRPSFPFSTPFFLLAVVAAALVVTPRPRYSPFARAALALTVLAGFMAVRYTPWLPLLVAVLAPAALDALRRPRAAERHVRINLALVAVGLVAVTVFVVLQASKPASLYERTLRPAARRAATEAAERNEGLVLASPQAADWLLWHNPGLRGRIAFDVRFELLTADELRRLGAFFSHSDPAWRNAAACCSVFVLHTDPAVIDGLRRDLRVVYSDDTTTVLVRRSPE